METKSPARRPSFATGVCPRCGSSSASPFSAVGVCLRCAGVRVLELESGHTPEPAISSTPTAGPEDLPERIGPYEIIDELGRGGMARVFAARQIGLGRIVAIKAIAAGRGDAADLELRFLREAQTVARLRHPNVVNIHDSGRAHGFVYFSMDYLEGGDLARRLRARPFTPREAATLLHRVADALAYTHGEGVLHRDLKPSNILLEGDEPRVADFGLAAQLDPGGDLTAATSVLGTPHYVAPEALRGGSAALSVASDLYSLGVILFELLVGRTPFAGASPAELAALVADTEPPAPRLLAPHVPRELETICLKCLERDPARRYPGAAAFAEDLRRFLADEPILARPPGPLERLSRFGRRHRATVAATVAIFAILTLATAVSATLAVRARRAEAGAADEAATAKALADFLENDLLGQAAPGAQPDRDVKLHTVVAQAAEQIDRKFADRPLIAAALHGTVGRVSAALGDFPAARRHLERSLALRRAQHAADDPLVLAAMSQVGTICHDLGRDDEADGFLAAALDGRRRTLGPAHPDTIAVANLRGIVLRDLGRIGEAGVLVAETLAAARAALPGPNELVARVVDTLGTIRGRERRLAEAEALAREAVALFTTLRGADDLETLSMMNNLASVCRETGRAAESLALQTRVLEVRRRVLPAGHPHVLIALGNLASIYKDLDRLAEAEALQTEAVALFRAAPGLGPDHPRTLATMRNLADTYRRRDDLPRATSLMTEVLAASRRSLGPVHPNTLSALAGVADMHVLQGQFAGAVPLFREALEGYAQSQLPGARVDTIRSKLGWALANLGQFAEAEPLLVGSYEQLTRPDVELPVGYRNFVRDAGQHVIDFYTMWNKPDRAAAWREKIATAKAKP